MRGVCATTLVTRQEALYAHNLARKYPLNPCECGCGTLVRNRFRRGHSNVARRLHPFEKLYKALVQAAKYKTLNVTITYEDFLEFTKQGSCHYCGTPVTWSVYGGEGASQAYHLDRKVNTMGYENENCVVCCTRCNKAKSNHFTYDEWYAMTEILRNKTI